MYYRYYCYAHYYYAEADAEAESAFGGVDDDDELVAALDTHDAEALLGHIDMRGGDGGDDK